MASAERVLLPRDLAARFSISALRGHFVLAREVLPLLDGWASYEHDGWRLMAEGSLPVMDIADIGGAHIGWMLGHPIHEDKLLDMAVQVPFAAQAPDATQRVKQYLDGLAGRFLAIVFAPGIERAYPDTIGSLAVVYSPEHEMLSSSPFLIPYRGGSEDEVDLLSALRVDATRGRLMFGLAPRRGMHRLLPNHVLELTTWTARRTWPSNELSGGVDPVDAVTAVGDTVRRNLSALVQRGPLTMSLTAGYASRMLLACARPFLDRIRFVTVPIPDWNGRVDRNAASEICRRHKLNHLVPAWKEASEEEQALWLYRTGFTAGEPRGQRAVRCYASLGNQQPLTEGLCGEFARKVRLEREKWSRGTPSPEALVAQFWGPVRQELVHQAAKWLEEVPVRDPITIVELSWMENSLGSWGGPLTYGFPDGCEFMVYPLAHRRNFELWFGLPTEYRASGQFAIDLIMHYWPDLLDIPFNKPVGMLRPLEGVRRLARRARAALTG